MLNSRCLLMAAAWWASYPVAIAGLVALGLLIAGAAVWLWRLRKQHTDLAVDLVTAADRASAGGACFSVRRKFSIIRWSKPSPR